MDSFEANKIFGAILGTIFVLFGGSLLAEGIFHSEVPEKPGYAIQAMESPAAGAAPAASNEVTPVGQVMASADPTAGATQFKKCQACHSGEKGGPNKVGPDLWDVVGRPIAAHEGFSYSAGMKDFAKQGDGKWDFDKLNHFIHGPKDYVKGTAMGFAGLKSDKDRGDLLAYLRTLGDNPAPLPPAEPAAAPAGGEDAKPATTTDAGGDSQPQGSAAGVGSNPGKPAEAAAPAPSGSPAPSAPAPAPAPGAAPAAPAPAAPPANPAPNAPAAPPAAPAPGAAPASPPAPPAAPAPASADPAPSAPAAPPAPPAAPAPAN